MDTQEFSFQDIVFFVFIGFILLAAPILVFINSYENYKRANLEEKNLGFSNFRNKFSMLIAILAFFMALILGFLFFLLYPI